MRIEEGDLTILRSSLGFDEPLSPFERLIFAVLVFSIWVEYPSSPIKDPFKQVVVEFASRPTPYIEQLQI